MRSITSSGHWSKVRKIPSFYLFFVAYVLDPGMFLTVSCWCYWFKTRCWTALLRNDRLNLEVFWFLFVRRNAGLRRGK